MKNNKRIEGLPGIFGAHKRMATYLFLALSMALVLPQARAQSDVRSGKDVVDTICAECHATGVDGAPKIGDREAWSSRAAQGLSNLTLHALEGIRKMPAHGGHPELSDLDIARAVTYMVNRSGGNWVEPAGEEELTGERSGEQVVKAQCVKCHGEGVGGAPKIGDLDAWVQRMKQGLPYLIRSAIRGHGGMPPRGGQANLTDNELRSAILYMYNPSGAADKPAPGAAKPIPAAGTEASHKVVGGLEIYMGFIAAEKLRVLPKDAPERVMHGGIPKGSGYYHVNVTLYDEKSGAPIKDAQIQMQLNWPGMASTTMTLEPMHIGAGSYGNYVKPQPGASYQITLRIKKPGTDPANEAKFKHKFE